MERSGNFYKAIRLGYILISILIGCMAYNSLYEWQEIEALELGNKKIDELLCLHKGDCWEKSFVVFQKNDEIKIMKGETYEWLDAITTSRGKMAEWFDAEEINVINGTEVTSVEINEKLKNSVLKCLEEISSK